MRKQLVQLELVDVSALLFKAATSCFDGLFSQI